MFDKTKNAVPTFANTLLTKHFPDIRHNRHTFFAQVVIPSCYPFFEWNERIYQVIDDRYVETTMVLTDVKPGNAADL